MKRKLKIAFIYPYYFPLKKVSGPIQYLSYLLEELGKHAEVMLITKRHSSGHAPNEKMKNYGVRRVSGPFPVSAAIAASKANADAVVFASSIAEGGPLVLAVVKILKLFNFSKPLVLYQLSVPGKGVKPFFGLSKVFCAKFFCASPSIKNFLDSAGLKGKTVLVEPGVDFKRLGKVKALPRKGKKLVGFFGHFIKRKGADIAVQAFKELNPKGAVLVLAGQDLAGGKKEEKELRAQVRGSENIKVVGFVEKHLPLLKSCSFTLLPFRDSIGVLGLSVSAMESLALGKPVIGFDTEAVSDIVRDGKTGFIVRDKEQMKQKIGLLLKDEKLLARMGKNAQKEMRGKYAIQKTASKLLAEIRAIA